LRSPIATAAIQRTAVLGDGWLGGFTAPRTAGQVIAAIKAALKDAGRRIDEDHYGVVVPYRIGATDTPAVARFRRAISERKDDLKSPSPARPIAVGDLAAVVDIFRQFVDAGVSKFVAIPLADDWQDLLVQTELLADQIRLKIEDR